MDSYYVHGSAPDEQHRLSRLNDLLNQACLRELCLQKGDRVFDVGSGTGEFTRLMLRAVGTTGRVLGVEREKAQLEKAMGFHEGSNPEFREGDAFSLPLSADEWGTYDIAHTRFLLEHVPDPLAVVKQMVRAVRPGGRIVLADDDHDTFRVWPEPTGLAELWRAYIRVYERTGNDAFVGRRLVSLLHQAGVAPKRNTFIFFGGCSGDPNFEGITRNLYELLLGAKDSIVKHAFFEASAVDAALDSLKVWSRRPDAAVWYSLYWAEGVRP